MIELFDTGFDSLTVGALRGFLNEAGEEGLTWEAKSEIPRPEQVQKAVSALANSIGGYLIVGAASRGPRGSGWDLNGFEPGQGEPGLRIVQMVQSGVSPVPRVEHKTLDLEDGRKCVVVRVEPVDAPPCITSSGIVFQRVSGASPPVTDHGVLSRLVSQGERARTAAVERASDAARRILDEPGTPVVEAEDFRSMFAMGMSAVGGPEDRSGVLFQDTRAQRFWDLVEERPRPASPTGPGPVSIGASQTSLKSSCASSWRPIVNTALAFRDGSAAIGFAASGQHRTDDVPVFGNLERFWSTLVDIIDLFEGAGDAYLVVKFHAPAAGARPRAWPDADIARWTEIRQPSEDELENVRREITRAFGSFSWEPESTS